MSIVSVLLLTPTPRTLTWQLFLNVALPTVSMTTLRNLNNSRPYFTALLSAMDFGKSSLTLTFLTFN
jgi:hypothetical protein